MLYFSTNQEEPNIFNGIDIYIYILLGILLQYNSAVALPHPLMPSQSYIFHCIVKHTRYCVFRAKGGSWLK